MFVHVDPQLFLRRPFLGVMLGTVSLVMWIVLFGILFREYRGFGEAPAPVDLKTIAPPAENHGKWVRVDQPLVVHCDLGIQELNDLPERWIFGRVANTFFIAGIEGSNRNLLLVYDRDATCEDGKRWPMKGVLQEINSRRKSYLSGERFVIPPTADMQLSVDEGPASYRRLMLLGSFLPVLSLVCIVRFWPKWRMQVRQAETAAAFGTVNNPRGF